MRFYFQVKSYKIVLGTEDSLNIFGALKTLQKSYQSFR